MNKITQSTAIQRTWKYAGAVSIRVKVLGIVLGVIILLGGAMIIQMRSVLIETLSFELEEQGVILANNIAQDAGDRLTTDDNYADLRLLLTERKAHYSSESHNTRVDYILVKNSDEAILFSEGEPTITSATPSPHPHGRHPVFIINGGATIEFHGTIPNTDWVLQLGLSTSRIHEMVNLVALRLFSITLVMVAIGFMAAFFLTWVLTRPIQHLVSATHAVAEGDFDVRVPRWADDEIGELATAFNRMTESLAQADKERHERERLRNQYINGVILAQENERQRIARELHDSTSQSLTSLLVGLQNIKQSPSQDHIANRVDDLREIVATTLDEIRNISWRLRPSALDDLGLVSAVENYVHEYIARHHIPTEVTFRGIEKRLAPEIETTIYRIIQEGLTNIARYAQATTISLVISCQANRIKIIIEDDGIGFNPDMVLQHKKSLGLRGMTERAGLLGGTLQIESAPQQGTSLYIDLPYSITESSAL
ncbi:MAG: sensor histidine kinase [bacterium]|nr:sensor histidine kinase [bacterium]